MAKKLMSVLVRGDRSRWGFEFYGDPQYLPDWRADGLDVHVVENVIPATVAAAGFARAWCIAQDLFNFRNPWRDRDSVGVTILTDAGDDEDSA